MFQTKITKTRWLVHKYYLPLIDVKNLYKKKNPSSLDSEKFVMKNDVLPADVLFSENPSKYSIKTRFPNQFLIPIIIK